MTIVYICYLDNQTSIQSLSITTKVYEIDSWRIVNIWDNRHISSMFVTSDRIIPSSTSGLYLKMQPKSVRVNLVN